MNRLSLLGPVLLIVTSCSDNATKKELIPVSNDIWSTYKLWYERPAEEWNQALPVGNGRLGAMVFGGVSQERIQLNEETLWTGGPYDPSREGGAAALPKIQRLVFAGEYHKAHNLFGRTMMGIPYEQMKYQPLANLVLHFPGHEGQTNYVRSLDLDKAIATISYSIGSIDYKREIFSSHPDDLIIMRFTASEAGSINFSANLHGVRNPSHSNYDNAYFLMDGWPPDALVLSGKNSDYLGVEGKLRYMAVLKIIPDGGEVSLDSKTLSVANANSVTMLFAAATNFVNYSDVSGNPEERVSSSIEKVENKSYEDLLRDHIKDYQELFRQLSIDFGGWDNNRFSTDQRITNYDPAVDTHLPALYFQFNRYLLISSSRVGTQAANLQGIWNQDVNPWWDSKYTVNINLPMNYWPAEVVNLEECTDPLFQLIRDVSQSGRKVARKHYGAKGWVLHQNTDIWRAAAPMDGPSWGAWPVGGAWLSTHLWEHFLFNGDTAFLREYYPIIKDQVRFQMDILVEDPETGFLVTNPSNSPENFPAWEGNDRFFDETTGIYLKAKTMTAGPTADMMILRELFGEFDKASTLLDLDKDMRDSVRIMKGKLAPLKIGKRGQLQEWLMDWDEVEPEHRHLSHLWGLYPGNEITPSGTPEFADASRKTLEMRGIGGCGWSMGHRMACWARLEDGNNAIKEFSYLIRNATNPNLFSNCFRALQVDGNFGATAGIAEMLLQSHNNYIQLLPALPDALPVGSVTGFRARGGFEIDFTWSDGNVTEATVRSKVGKQFVIKSRFPFSVVSGDQEDPGNNLAGWSQDF